VSDLLDAGKALRADPGDRGAIEAERSAVEGVLAEAERLLPAPSVAVAERMRDTLHAAAGDAEVAERLRAGRLVEDHRAVGLGPWATGDAPKAEAAPGKARAPAPRGRTAAPKKGRGRPSGPTTAATKETESPALDAAARKRLRAAEREAEKARRELAAAERDRERAELAFRSAERAHAEAAERSRKADTRLEELG
jgi:hypothetical protein